MHIQSRIFISNQSQGSPILSRIFLIGILLQNMPERGFPKIALDSKTGAGIIHMMKLIVHILFAIHCLYFRMYQIFFPFLLCSHIALLFSFTEGCVLSFLFTIH